jgi:hypothetical protein
MTPRKEKHGIYFLAFDILIANVLLTRLGRLLEFRNKNVGWVNGLLMMHYSGKICR